MRRALVITDPGVGATGTPQRAADQIARFGIEAGGFDGVHVEPTDESMNAAIEQARASGPWDCPADEAKVPHGMPVALTAPEAYRFTLGAAPQRHLRAARLLAPEADRPPEDPEFLHRVLTSLIRDIW